MSKLYTEARQGKLHTQEAARLTYLLQAIIGAIRDSELEQRIAALEAGLEKESS